MRTVRLAAATYVLCEDWICIFHSPAMHLELFQQGFAP
jgi:hypothetical protein